MPTWKEGDRVRIVARPVTDEDRKKNQYFEHMGGLIGTIQNVYEGEIAVKVDKNSLSKVSRDIHKGATERLRERFLASGISEEQKKLLTADELNFDVHYMLLVLAKDLETA